MKIKLLVALLVLLMVVGVGVAQEVTPTVEAGEPILVEVPNSGGLPSALLSAGFGFGMLVLGMGIGNVLTIRGLGSLANRVMSDKPLLASIEALGNSTPRETTDRILTVFAILGDVTKSLESIAKLGREAFDGVPADSKPRIIAEAAPRPLTGQTLDVSIDLSDAQG